MRFNLEMKIKYSNTHAMKACAECESCSETSDSQARGLPNRPVYFMPEEALVGNRWAGLLVGSTSHSLKGY